MGYEDREYSQDQFSAASWGNDTPTTKRLLFITVIVFFAQTLLTYQTDDPFKVLKYHSTRVSYVDEWFMLDASSVAHGQVWRLVTYAFCHHRQDPFSLVFDMLLLWFLGRRLERMYGSREFLLYYLGSSFAAGTLFAAIGLTAILPTPLCGAAPAIMAIFALYALHFPREEILVFFLVPVQIFILVIIYIGVDIYSVLRAVQGEIGWEMAAHTAAHLCGAVFAFLYKHYDWHLSGIWQRITGIRTAWKRATARRRLKVYAPAPEVDQLDGKLDAILAKIHEQGSESLTDSERAVLARASERYKKR